MNKKLWRIVPLVCATLFASTTYGGESFVNWETPHVHPLDITPDGLMLLAVNTADNRLEVFDNSGEVPVYVASIPVGLDPVTVRARSNTEAWVVNHISDSVSIVDLTALNVVTTFQTDDEPCDVVFAGQPEMAFVTCSQADTILVVNPDQPNAQPTRLAIEGQDPRALAVSPDGNYVYAAVFESGNQTTVLGHHSQGFVVNEKDGPYGGQNPPPNDGSEFNPPINPDNPPAPDRFGLIVRKSAEGTWLDDNIGDWTSWISGEHAGLRRRVEGWDVIDNDVVVIDANAAEIVDYMTGMMTFCMSLDVNPLTGDVYVVGTEATNEIRFEPILKARFTRVRLAGASMASPDDPSILDLNPHLDYSDEQIEQQADTETASQELRDESIGDPRAILWTATGQRVYLAGMGSNNVVVLDDQATRVAPPVRVGQGPTGLAIHPNGQTLYVLNKFDATISVIDTDSLTEELQVAFYDPTPEVIKLGRPHLYDTQRTSGLGQISCASCHVDGRHDMLAWDLGNPAGTMTVNNNNCGMDVQIDCPDLHPMKGVMMTQTLQDIIGKEPLHWRGDKFGLEDFNGAFTGLQGDDVMLTAEEMQEFEDFLATLHFPPNPFRNFDNSLPTDLPLPGSLSVGKFELEFGDPMPNGNPQVGLEIFRTVPMHAAGPGETATCVQCHTLPSGLGTNVIYVIDEEPCHFPELDCAHLEELPVGPDGERHLMTTKIFGNPFKVPQLRSLYDKRGYEGPALRSRGFSSFHDGGNSVTHFLEAFGGGLVEGMTSIQDVADVAAFLFCFTGSDLPVGSMDNATEPPGPASKDAHAAVGKQVTITQANKDGPNLIARLDEMMAEADQERVGIVVKGLRDQAPRGYSYFLNGVLQSDIAGELTTMEALRTATVIGDEITVTVVPFGTQIRIGIDRDEDGFYDGDELLACSDPADPLSIPGVCCEGDANGDGLVDPLDSGFVLARFGCSVGTGDPSCDIADQNGDGLVDPLDVGFILARFGDCP